MKKIKGFTLLELIITISIVMVLSLISWPIYRKHSKEYTILAEGYALLGAIKEAQINYYNEYGYFPSPATTFNRSFGIVAGDCWTANDPLLGINSMNNKYFSSFNAYDAAGNPTFYPQTTKQFFIAGVRSTNYGSIIMPFYLTERSEITLKNVKNVTM